MNFLSVIKSGRRLVADGDMGTMLFQRGLKPGDCPEAMNLDHPEVLTEVARLYFEAGADIVQTNTFGGSSLKLAQYGLESRVKEIACNAVDAVRTPVGRKALVSGSCGPCGRLLEPFGDISADAVLDSFKEQTLALIEAGVDIICVETMTDLNEAVLAVKASKAIRPNTPVMATMTFDSTPRGFYTIMGTTIEQACKGLADAGADVIGSNCGNGIENMVRIAAEFRKHTLLPLIIQSNAGLPKMIDGHLVYAETPEFMAKHCERLLEVGVNIIGGCCGTTPEHIAAFRAVVDKYNKEQA